MRNVRRFRLKDGGGVASPTKSFGETSLTTRAANSGEPDGVERDGNHSPQETAKEMRRSIPRSWRPTARRVRRARCPAGRARRRSGRRAGLVLRRWCGSGGCRDEPPPLSRQHGGGSPRPGWRDACARYHHRCASKGLRLREHSLRGCPFQPVRSRHGSLIQSKRLNPRRF